MTLQGNNQEIKVHVHEDTHPTRSFTPGKLCKVLPLNRKENLRLAPNRFFSGGRGGEGNCFPWELKRFLMIENSSQPGKLNKMFKGKKMVVGNCL